LRESPVKGDIRATWVQERHELPTRSPGPDTYAETYQLAIWSPAARTGIWLHLTSGTLGLSGQWERQLAIALPDDHYVLGKEYADGVIDGSRLSVGGVSIDVARPLHTWQLTLRTAGRMVTRKEIRAGALGDGPHVPVLATITSQAATPPFDFGTHTLRTKDHAAIVDIPALDAKGHYEQAHQLAGKLSVDGAIVRLDDGVGFRSRSWGQRDYRPIGCSSYVHAHFPGSGQMLMAITLRDAQGQPAFSHAIIGTAESITAPSLAGLPVAHDF
jgi:hypothetical protein